MYVQYSHFEKGDIKSTQTRIAEAFLVGRDNTAIKGLQGVVPKQRFAGFIVDGHKTAHNGEYIVKYAANHYEIFDATEFVKTFHPLDDADNSKQIYTPVGQTVLAWSPNITGCTPGWVNTWARKNGGVPTDSNTFLVKLNESVVKMSASDFGVFFSPFG